MRTLVAVFIQMIFLSLSAFADPTTVAPVELYPDQLKTTTVLASARCRDSNDLPLKMIDAQHLAPECTPDVLYSWGPFAKAQTIWSQLKNVKSWKFTWRTLYTSQAPLATFGYGAIPLRLKLKKGVSFIFFRKSSGIPTDICEQDAARNQHAVYFRGQDRYADIVVCSPEVLHSISYETKLHYNEMILDYRQHKRDPRGAMYYATMQTSDLFGASVDENNFSEQSLLSKLRDLLSYIESDKGDLIYNPSVPVAEQTARNHFSTQFPTYFNQRVAPAGSGVSR